MKYGVLDFIRKWSIAISFTSLVISIIGFSVVKTNVSVGLTMLGISIGFISCNLCAMVLHIMFKNK